MVARRSRRAQKKPPEVVPPKSDEEPNAEEGDTNTAESEEDNDTDANTSSTPRRRQRGRKKTGSGVSENEENSSDEGKSRENTDTGDSSDDEPLSSKAANQAKRARRQKKSAETDDAGKKTPKRRGRPRKNADVESNDEDGSDADKETIRKSKRRTAGRRKQQDPSSGSDDESAKRVKRKMGRPRKNQDAEDSDSKMESAEDESSGNEEESAKKVKRKIGRPRKNQDAEDSDSKMESAEGESSENDDESAKKPKRRRGRPRKNQDAEDSDSKVEAAEEESANEDESAKEPKRRRGRPRKNQDAEDSDSKVEAVEEESANEDESAKKPKRRRGRPRKNQDAEDSDSKVETAEEDGDSSDDENSTVKSKDKPKSKPSKTAEDASSDESTSRPTRRRGRPKKSSEASSNDEGEQETRPNGTTKNATTRQTPAPSSNDEQSSDEEAPQQRRRPGRSRSASTDEKGSNEASEPTSRKRGRGRITPPVSSNDDEPAYANQRTRVSKRRLEKIDETTPPETVTPSDEKAGEEPTDTNTGKPATGGETTADAAAKNKNEDESLSSKPEPQQEKEAKASSIAGANFKNANKGSPSKPEKQEKQETSNRSTAETSKPTLPAKMDCVPAKPPADTYWADTVDDAEMKDKASTNLCESTETISDSAAESVVRQAEPISKKAEAKSSSKPVEEKESASKQSKSSTTTEDGKVLHPGAKVPAAEENVPSEETSNSKVPDAPEKETAPEEKEMKADVVLTATDYSNDKAVCTGEGKKAELPTKVEPLVPKPTARASSESPEAVSLTNAPAEKKEAQGSEQSRPQLSVELNQSKPIAENDAPITSLEPAKEIEPNDAVKVQPLPPVSTTAQLKPQYQSLTKHEKTPKVELSDLVVASSVEVEKAGNTITKGANRASAMDVDSPVKDVKMTDVEESTPTPQEDPQIDVPAETSHAKESQFKPSEILQPAPITTPIDSEQETLPSLDTEPPSTVVATKSILSETVVIPTDSSALHENSSAKATDSKEAVASDEISECGESSPVTESSDDEDETDDEEDRPEPRFETKVLPFTSSSLVPSPSKEHTSLELLRNKVNRVKTMLYTIGSRVHRGRGFERIFAKYWDALTMRLSDRLSSHASRQCDAAIKTFLKSPKLRRIHNKLVVTLMKTSMKSFAPLNEIAEYIPEIWYEKVKQVDRVLIENEVKETKSQRKAREKRATRQQTTVYREAWASTQAAEENPISAVCLKTRCQEVDMRKIHASSASIPGALVIDPLVRDIAEQSSMRASENAIWLLVVAAREHASNVLKNTVKHKQDMECGEVSEPFLQYPKVIAGTKNASKKDTPADKTEQQPPAPVDYMPGKSQTRKVVTSFDVYASSLVAPTGPPASLGGSVSTTALELCLQNAYTSSSSFPGTDFYDVQKHIVEGITALAQDRKAMLLARGEEAKSNQVNIVNSQQQVETNSRNIVNNSNVAGNAHGGVGAPSAMRTPVPVRGQAPQNEHNAPTTQPALAAQRKKIDVVPSKAPTTVAAAPLSTPADTGDTKSLSAIPGGLGRGAKDLASLMKRSPKAADPPVTSPATDGKGTIATESSAPSKNSSPQKPAESSDVDELGTSTGSGRRGKGFGTKNLAALKARSTPEEKAARSESVPTTVVVNEPQKQEPPKAGTKPIGAKNLAALKGPAGAKDLAALRARSVAKASDAVGGKNEGTEQKSEAKPGDTTEQRPDPKAPETSTKADAAVEASVSPNPSKVTDDKADPLKSADPANETKVDSANAPSPADNKKADIIDSNGNKSGDKDTKGGESDDNSVVVIERVKPPSKADKKDTSSSAGKGAVATSGQPNGQKVEGKETNATVDTQPKPAVAPEKPKDSTAAVEADKSPNAASTDKKESELSKDTPATDESKSKSEAKEDGATLTSPPTTATDGPAASKDAPGAAPNGGEAPNEATKNAGGDTAGARKPDETKVTEGNIAKPEGAKSDESGAAKPEEAKTDEKGEPSK